MFPPLPCCAFCKKLGCDGYAEFKLRMKEYADRSEEAIDFSSQVPAVVLAETLAKRVASRLTED